MRRIKTDAGLKYKTRPKSKYRKRRRMRRMLALLLSAVLLCAGGVLLARYLLRLRDAAYVNAELAQIYAEDARPAEKDTAASSQQNDTANVEGEGYQFIGTEIIPECQTLYRINPDLVGWLNIPGELDLPVVYRDNTYYLDHDFYGQKNDSGTVFLDEAHPFEEDSQYLFFHGHNVWDGSMLGNLTHYRNVDYIRENPYLYFNTLYRRETYEIVAVLTVSQEEMYGLMRLGTPSFVNGAEFNAFINSLRSRALRFTPEEIHPDDALLAISTCWEEERIVVLFRRVDRQA